MGVYSPRELKKKSYKETRASALVSLSVLAINHVFQLDRLINSISSLIRHLLVRRNFQCIESLTDIMLQAAYLFFLAHLS